MQTNNKLREALTTIRKRLVAAYESEACFMRYSPNKPLVDLIDAALATPPRNCDKYPTFNDAIRSLADKRGWHDAKWDSERYCILASWLLAPATEKEGGAK